MLGIFLFIILSLINCISLDNGYIIKGTCCIVIETHQGDITNCYNVTNVYDIINNRKAIDFGDLYRNVYNLDSSYHLVYPINECYQLTNWNYLNETKNYPFINSVTKPTFRLNKHESLIRNICNIETLITIILMDGIVIEIHQKNYDFYYKAMVKSSTNFHMSTLDTVSDRNQYFNIPSKCYSAPDYCRTI